MISECNVVFLLTVATIPWAWCRSPRPVKLNNHTGYLASITTEEHGCGSRDNPWVISVLPGQRVNLTLFDFNVTFNDSTVTAGVGGGLESRRAALGGGGVGGTSSDLILGRNAATYSSFCTQYAIVEEESVGRSTVICGGDTREKHVYLSSSNEISIQITGRKTNPVNHFIIKYEGK